MKILEMEHINPGRNDAHPKLVVTKEDTITLELRHAPFAELSATQSILLGATLMAAGKTTLPLEGPLPNTDIPIPLIVTFYETKNGEAPVQVDQVTLKHISAVHAIVAVAYMFDEETRRRFSDSGLVSCYQANAEVTTWHTAKYQGSTRAWTIT